MYTTNLYALEHLGGKELVLDKDVVVSQSEVIALNHSDYADGRSWHKRTAWLTVSAKEKLHCPAPGEMTDVTHFLQCIDSLDQINSTVLTI